MLIDGVRSRAKSSCGVPFLHQRLPFREAGKLLEFGSKYWEQNIWMSNAVQVLRDGFENKCTFISAESFHRVGDILC